MFSNHASTTHRMPAYHNHKAPSYAIRQKLHSSPKNHLITQIIKQRQLRIMRSTYGITTHILDQLQFPSQKLLRGEAPVDLPSKCSHTPRSFNCLPFKQKLVSGFQTKSLNPKRMSDTSISSPQLSESQILSTYKFGVSGVHKRGNSTSVSKSKQFNLHLRLTDVVTGLPVFVLSCQEHPVLFCIFPPAQTS